MSVSDSLQKMACDILRWSIEKMRVIFYFESFNRAFVMSLQFFFALFINSVKIFIGNYILWSKSIFHAEKIQLPGNKSSEIIQHSSHCYTFLICTNSINEKN
jgi:hypothetical protein